MPGQAAIDCSGLEGSSLGYCNAALFPLAAAAVLTGRHPQCEVSTAIGSISNMLHMLRRKQSRTDRRQTICCLPLTDTGEDVCMM